MGREIFHGEPQGAGGKADLYDAGVREGAVGLLFCSVALGVTSFLIPKLCRTLTSRVVWSVSNLMVFVLMTAMVVLGMVSMKGYKPSLAASLSAGPDHAFKSSALAIFACIGIPPAVRRSTRVLFCFVLFCFVLFCFVLFCIGLDCAR
jgi:solute carrier family 45 protein 1/2/4